MHKDDGTLRKMRRKSTRQIKRSIKMSPLIIPKRRSSKKASQQSQLNRMIIHESSEAYQKYEEMMSSGCSYDAQEILARMQDAVKEQISRLKIEDQLKLLSETTEQYNQKRIPDDLVMDKNRRKLKPPEQLKKEGRTSCSLQKHQISIPQEEAAFICSVEEQDFMMSPPVRRESQLFSDNYEKQELICKAEDIYLWVEEEDNE